MHEMLYKTNFLKINIFMIIALFSTCSYASDEEKRPLISSSNTSVNSSTVKIISSIKKEDDVKNILKKLSLHENKTIKKKAKWLLKREVLGIIGEPNYTLVENWIEIYAFLSKKELYDQFYENFKDCNAYKILSPLSLRKQISLRHKEFCKTLIKSNLH